LLNSKTIVPRDTPPPRRVRLTVLGLMDGVFPSLLPPRAVGQPLPPAPSPGRRGGGRQPLPGRGEQTTSALSPPLRPGEGAGGRGPATAAKPQAAEGRPPWLWLRGRGRRFNRRQHGESGVARPLEDGIQKPLGEIHLAVLSNAH